MSWESNLPEEPRDRARWVWAGIAAVCVLAVAVLWFAEGRDAEVSIVRARHILITFDRENPADRARALETLNDLRDRLARGERFRRLARDYSNDPSSAARGGDLGYARRGKYEPAFDAYVWSAPVGELSDVVETQFGFHLIEVLERQ